MSKFKREDIHPRCDNQKLKKMESSPSVRELRDKIEQLIFRLTGCKNENQMLKRDLQQAKKMVYKEVGDDASLDFQDMLKHGPDSNRKERMETVAILKRKVQELQNYLNQLEGKKDNQSAEHPKMKQNEDKKDFWKIELERRKSREMAEKDTNPLLEERNDLRRRLIEEKTRFKELREQVNLLRAELESQIDKNEGDMGLTKSFRTIEDQLRDTLEERAEIRKEVVGCKSRNKTLEDKISALKGDLQMLLTTAQDNKVLIDCYTKKHKQIEEAIEAEKSLSQQEMENYESEWQVLKNNYDSDVAILGSLQSINAQRHQLISELKGEFASNFLQVNLRIQNQINTTPLKRSNEESDYSSNTVANEDEKTTGNKTLDDTFAGNSVKLQREDASLRRTQLIFDVAMYQKLLEASRNEKDHLQHLSRLQDRQMQELETQVVETGRFILAKDIEKNSIRERINRMQRTLLKKDKRDKALPSKDELEELRIKIDGQKEENSFLRNFLVSAINNRAEEFTLHKKFLNNTKQFFEDAFQDIVRDFNEYKVTTPIDDISVNIDQ